MGEQLLRNLAIRQGAVDIVIIVPPFSALHQPALGPHLLQACARQAGYRVSVVYANLLVAREIGVPTYRLLSSQPRELLGERIFARAAYGVPALGRRNINDDVRLLRALAGGRPRLGLADLRRIERIAATWVADFAADLASWDTGLVGFSTSFEQTAASAAISRRLKTARPEIQVIAGGANCEGEMAHGLLGLHAGFDYIFSGESERAFVAFLQERSAGRLPPKQIIEGEPQTILDSLPTPDFSEYFDQLVAFLPDASVETWIPYEASRGCWWGQKHHCTFCGLNGNGMAFRSKSPDRVLSELTSLVRDHPSQNVCMTDNIMPHDYFGSVIPRLAENALRARIFYEQKANLTFKQVLSLKRAGVDIVQPGIEALSTSLLRRMVKGVSAAQNISLLRYAASAGVHLEWNLLYGFPGDEVADYESQIALLPLLSHLQPPRGLSRLIIDRFSPYFADPERYGIREVRPYDGYYSVLPETAEIAKVAYHFTGEYESGILRSPETLRMLAERVGAWRRSWHGHSPSLSVERCNDGSLRLIDSRSVAKVREVALTDQQGELLVSGRRSTTGQKEWAISNGWAVLVDGSFVPLATASPELMQKFDV